MFRELFEAAVSVSPPAGLAPSNQVGHEKLLGVVESLRPDVYIISVLLLQSRAMYAADLMLEWVNGESETAKQCSLGYLKLTLFLTVSELASIIRTFLIMYLRYSFSTKTVVAKSYRLPNCCRFNYCQNYSTTYHQEVQGWRG